MFHKVMIVLAAVAFVGSTSTPGVHAFGDKNGRAEFGDTHIGGAFAFAGYPDVYRHVSRGPRTGSGDVDLGVKSYGCLAHPGLWSVHPALLLTRR
jgi:hypothetical protein